MMMRAGNRRGLRTLAFDASGFDPSEWEELFLDIATALEREGLPSLFGDRWEQLEFGFEFSGTAEEIRPIESVLNDEFGVRVYRDDTPLILGPPISEVIALAAANERTRR